MLRRDHCPINPTVPANVTETLGLLLNEDARPNTKVNGYRTLNWEMGGAP